MRQRDIDSESVGFNNAVLFGHLDKEIGHAVRRVVTAELDAATIGRAEPAGKAAQQRERHPRAVADKVDELSRRDHLRHHRLHRDDGRDAWLEITVDRGELAHEVARTADRQERLAALGRGPEHLDPSFSEEHHEVRPVALHEERGSGAVATLLAESEEADPVFPREPAQEAACLLRRHGPAPYTSPRCDEFVAVESSSI